MVAVGLAMPSVGCGVFVAAPGVPPAGWVMALNVDCTAVSTASTVACTLVPPLLHARLASASIPLAPITHSHGALRLFIVWSGRARLLNTNHFAVIIEHDAKPKHTQVGAC